MHRCWKEDVEDSRKVIGAHEFHAAFTAEGVGSTDEYVLTRNHDD